MRRLTLSSKDGSRGQCNSQPPLPTKKLCSRKPIQPNLVGSQRQCLVSTLPPQLYPNPSIQYQVSNDYYHEEMGKEIPDSANKDDITTKQEFLGFEKVEEDSRKSNSGYTSYGVLPQARTSSNKNRSNLYTPKVYGVSNGYNSFNALDFASNNSFSMSNNPLNYINLLKIDQPQLNFQPGNFGFQSNQIQNLWTQNSVQTIEEANKFNNQDLEGLKEEEISVKIQDDVKQEETDDSSYRSFFDEIDAKVSEFLIMQNKLLTDFKEKNHLIHDTLTSALGEIKNLNQILKERKVRKIDEFSLNPMMIHQNISNSNESVTSEVLIDYLCGPNQDFDYHLVLKSEFQLPLYRERNFKLTVLLMDKKGSVVHNLMEIPLKLSIYTSENPPQTIEINNSGNKVLKGINVKRMANGLAIFDKIQIKEVTSHLRNGWIFLVVQPIISPDGMNCFLRAEDSDKSTIDFSQIKPLVIDKIVVKAKKLKERDIFDGSEGDMPPPK